MKLLKHIPNLVTCLNLFTGCMAIVAAFNYNLELSAVLIIIAALLDFFDGLLARLLDAKSDFGKELDSLADIVSFGIAPAVIVFHLFVIGLQVWDVPLPDYLSLFVFIIPVFSALRLARFNTDPVEERYFSGLSTPANALFWASVPLIINIQGPRNDFYAEVSQWLTHPAVLAGLVIVLSFLLVSNIKLFSLKFKNLSWKENNIRFIFFIMVVVAFLIFFFAAVPILLILYIFLSAIHFKFLEAKPNKIEEDEVQS